MLASNAQIKIGEDDLYIIDILLDSGIEMQCTVLETSHLIGKKFD